MQNINGRILMDYHDYTTSSGDNHNLVSHSSCIIVNVSNAGDAITGIVPERAHSGEMIYVINNSANYLILKNNTGSDSENRIRISTGKNHILRPGSTAILVYVDWGDIGWRLEVPRRRELYSGTSNGSGVYTVTYDVPFDATPNIQATIAPQTQTNRYIRVSSVSNTGFTINAFQFDSLLGAVQTGTSNVSGLGIDVVVEEK